MGGAITIRITRFSIRTISIFGSCVRGDCLFENGQVQSGGDVRETAVTMWNPLRNARSKAHYGLRSDIAALPKSAKASHRVAAAPNPTESTSSELQDPQN